MSWFEAKRHCKSRGAHLVEINSEEENAAIVDEILNGGEEKSSFFWIGLTDKSKEGTWKLASNGSKAIFLNWDRTYANRPEPNNYEGNEHCAFIRSGGCNGWDHSAWADYDCSKNMMKIRCSFKTEVQFSMNALCEFEDAGLTGSSQGGE